MHVYATAYNMCSLSLHNQNLSSLSLGRGLDVKTKEDTTTTTTTSTLAAAAPPPPPTAAAATTTAATASTTTTAAATTTTTAVAATTTTTTATTATATSTATSTATCVRFYIALVNESLMSSYCIYFQRTTATPVHSTRPVDSVAMLVRVSSTADQYSNI